MSHFWFHKGERVDRLLKELYQRGMSDRSSEWFKKSEFKDIGVEYPNKPVAIRKAYAIQEMLEKMTDENISRHTHTYEIGQDERIVGVIPMGSNGLGKVFPNYLTETERRVAAFTNRTELSLLGHNSIDYNRLLKGGLTAIIDEAQKKLSKAEQNSPDEQPISKGKREFYKAVVISCQAVIAYSKRYAELAKRCAEEPGVSLERREELQEIARICNKVPEHAPNTYREALQAIYTFHTALHASLNYISLGRLDQVLNQYLDKDRLQDEAYMEECTELFECFIIKAASRLNLTTEYLLKQDHMDNNAALGTHPYYLDQRAGVNNFLQNIIVGGLTPDGEDATNPMTYVILNAYANVNLSTPGIYVRLHKDSPAELVRAVAAVLNQTSNIPGILNDDVLIPALHNSLLDYRKDASPEEREKYQRLANDYCVDGCWEPILNGVSDWTFCMLNSMPILQCTINRGASLDTNPGMLRGGKLSFISDEVTNYEEFQINFKKYMQFFIDQATFNLYECYMMDEYVNPSPLFSAVLGGCMEKGRDKAWGGTEYNIGGTILIGIPDVINTTAAIKKWVFDEKKYTLPEVREAMKADFTAGPSDVDLGLRYQEMKNDFDVNSPKFGDAESNEIGRFIINTFCDAVEQSKSLADIIFLEPIEKSKLRAADLEVKGRKSKLSDKQILRLRKIAGYYGASYKQRFGDDFNMHFTAGCGTFEQFPQQGVGIVASANRGSNQPMTANFSPAPGTIGKGVGNVFESMKGLPMERLSAGAITDLCIDESMKNEDYIVGVLDKFRESNGNMLTLAFGRREVYQKIYELCYEASNTKNNAALYRQLEQYKHINVRVGGWQAPFISMSLGQQKDYILRIVNH